MRNDMLVLEARNSCTLNWHANAAHLACLDMRSQIDSVFTIDKSSISSDSTKQKCNTCISAKNDLNGTNDSITKVMQRNKLLEA